MLLFHLCMDLIHIWTKQQLFWPWPLYDFDQQGQIFQFYFNCHNFFIYYWFNSYLVKTTLLRQPTCWELLSWPLTFTNKVIFYEFCLNFHLYNYGFDFYLDKIKLVTNLTCWMILIWPRPFHDLGWQGEIKYYALHYGFPFLNKEKIWAMSSLCSGSCWKFVSHLYYTWHKTIMKLRCV